MDECVVPTRCETTGERFEMRFRRVTERPGAETWEAIEAEAASGDGDGSSRVSERRLSGDFRYAAEYPGCPHCGQPSFLHCGDCDSLACWDETPGEVVCPWCQSTIYVTEGIDSIQAHEEDDGGEAESLTRRGDSIDRR